MKRLSNWIEIPVHDMARGTEFYERILRVRLHPLQLDHASYALFPSEDHFNCGALAQGEGYEPAATGVTVYLDGANDIDGILARVREAGGTVLLPRTYMNEDAGHIAMFLDSEGNRIGLQTP